MSLNVKRLLFDFQSAIGSTRRFVATLMTRGVRPQASRSCVILHGHHQWRLLVMRHSCTAHTEGTCWKCGKQVGNTLFCPSCNTLQKFHKGINYFQVLDIAETFNVDERELSRRHKNLQRQLHPDKFSIKHKQEQVISSELSSLVNKAYSTLSHPLSRGSYLLEIRGVSLSEDSASVGSGFLQEIMERNEEVEEARTEEQLRTLFSETRGTLETLAQQLGAAFDRQDLIQAKQIIIKMKYYSSIEAQLQKAIREVCPQ